MHVQLSLLLILLGAPLLQADESKPQAGLGIMVGEVTDTSALVQVRLTKTDKLEKGDVPGASGVVEFTVRPAKGRTARPTPVLVKATADRDFIARASFTGLAPDTGYICTTRIGPDEKKLRAGPQATFQTLPGKDSSHSARFVVVTGMNYAKFHGDKRIDRKKHLEHNNIALPPPYNGPDKHLGYPALASILKLKPNFFVGTGDNVYYDTPTKGRAETLPQMRQKWHEQFVQPRYRDLFARVPTFWMIDDHDYRVDDCDNTGDYKPTPAEGRRIMLEQLPVAPVKGEDKAKTYRTHRVNKDLQIWLPEGRMYRSPNKMPDGPKKTIWGAEQKAWLKKTLKESDATFKLLISPTPMIGPDDKRKTDNHTNLGGFRHERDEFFDWLKKTGIAKHFYLVCGDRHWQYHSIDPSGLEEFSSGALVDANARLGRKPGDPMSTDPRGLIKQAYAQKKPSGGFLLIEVAPGKNGSTLTFTHHDEKGKVLYTHTKTAK